MAVLIKRGPPIKDYDIPSTIVVYVLVCLLGVGMCFCLRRANRLLPNQLSFQLRPTSTDHRRRGYEDEEAQRGLLSEYDDDGDDGWGPSTQQQERSLRSARAYEDEDEPFGELQSAATTTTTNRATTAGPDSATAAAAAPPAEAQTPVFNIADEDEDEDEDDRVNKHPISQN